MNKKAGKETGVMLLKVTVAFIFIISFFSTQYFAYLVKYNSKLGGIKILNFKVYFPHMYFLWRKRYINQLPKTIETINWYIFIAMATYFILVIIFLKKMNENTVHGSARWSTKNDIKKMDLYKPTGVVLGCDPNGRLLHDNSDRHIAFFAPTRGGKGINSVTPTCYDWTNSIVINDIKGELWHFTSGYRKEILGQKVYMFCPVDTEGISCSINPLDFIDIGTASEFKDISIISKTLIDVEGKGDSDHWITSAINFINGVILHVKYSKENASLTDVVEFVSPSTGSLVDNLADILGVPREDEADETGVALRNGDTQNSIRFNEKGEQVYPSKGYATFDHLSAYKDKDLFKKIYNYKGTERDKSAKLHPIVSKEFMSLFSTPDKERGSIISTATQKLKIFMDPTISKHIRYSDFKIEDLKNERCSLYLVTPPDSLSRTQPLLRIIFTQIIFKLTKKMTFNTANKKASKENIFIESYENIKKNLQNFFFVEKKKEKNTILFLIDEFPSLGKLDVVEQSMSYIAGYGLKIFLISQSLGQFRKIYGKDNYILDNCSIQLYLTPNDEATPKMLSEILDKYTVKVDSYSKKGFELAPTRSTSYVARPLMTVSEVRTLPYKEIIIMITGQNPIKGKKLFYYADKRYAKKRTYPALEMSDRAVSIDELVKIKEKIKSLEFVIIKENADFNYEKELEKINENYKATTKIKYEELATLRFQLMMKYIKNNKENIEVARKKYFDNTKIKNIGNYFNSNLKETIDNALETQYKN